MAKKSDIKKETAPKKTFIEKVFGKSDEKIKEEKEKKPEVKLEKFTEPPPERTGNPFKDAIAMSAWRGKQRQINRQNNARLREGEKPQHSTIDFSKEAGRPEGSGGSGDENQND
jgi:hypothetical protein